MSASFAIVLFHIGFRSIPDHFPVRFSVCVWQINFISSSSSSSPSSSPSQLFINHLHAFVCRRKTSGRLSDLFFISAPCPSPLRICDKQSLINRASGRAVERGRQHTLVSSSSSSFWPGVLFPCLFLSL